MDASGDKRSVISQITGFDRTRMQKTTTRVRTASGKLYEENIRDEAVVSKFVGNEVCPAYLEDSINGFSAIIPGRYDGEQKRWANFIYSDNYSHKSATTRDCINKVSFVTFNLWFVDMYLRERAAAVFDILTKLRPDFVCLQEVTPLFLELLKADPFIQSHYFLSDFQGNTVYPYGTAILSHYPISRLRVHMLPTNQGRRLLDAEVVLEKSSTGGATKKIYISTIHMESLDNEEMRIAQMKTIFPILEKYEDSFFMGDFNFPDNTNEEHHISSKFTDVWKELNKSYPKEGEAGAATTADGRYDRIVYSSKMFVSTTVNLIGTNPIDQVTSETVYPSDHKGLYACFSTKSEWCRD